jgi:hypothetical protein
MPSSYQQRLNENKELRENNKLLEEKLREMQRAVNILNACITKMSLITYNNTTDLELQFKELCDEMEQDKLLNNN